MRACASLRNRLLIVQLISIEGSLWLVPLKQLLLMPFDALFSRHPFIKLKLDRGRNNHGIHLVKTGFVLLAEFPVGYPFYPTTGIGQVPNDINALGQEILFEMGIKQDTSKGRLITS